MPGRQRQFNPSRDLSGLPKRIGQKLRDIWNDVVGPSVVPKIPKIPGKWPIVVDWPFRPKKPEWPKDLDEPEPPSPVFYVSGDRFGPFSNHRPWLFDNNHHVVILRGINLPIFDDWEFPDNAPVGALGDVARSGANCVRIQWYVDYGNPDREKYMSTPTLKNLDAVLQKCAEHRLIPALRS